MHTPQSMAKADLRNFHALRSCMGPSCIGSFVPCLRCLTVLREADERRKIEVLQISLATRCCAASNNMMCFLLNATSTHMEQENHALETALTTNNMSQPIPTIPLDPFLLIPALLGLSFCGDRYVRLLDYCWWWRNSSEWYDLDVYSPSFFNLQETALALIEADAFALRYLSAELRQDREAGWYSHDKTHQNPSFTFLHSILRIISYTISISLSHLVCRVPSDLFIDTSTPEAEARWFCMHWSAPVWHWNLLLRSSVPSSKPQSCIL